MCAYVKVGTSVCARMHVCARVYAFVYVCMLEFSFARARACRRILHTCVGVYVRVCVCLCVHARVLYPQREICAVFSVADCLLA